ncbi:MULTISPECIES: hypothetical protein [Sutcliffiella]|uniref:hypothetical protein n=1 Tax=Sutcliffiella TaxID=2837511 RepID=UPI0022DE72AA|nr:MULTISPECIES: hypothetical protein [Sutcliffiella]MED4019021.1 hypothetical protein [Sutcliffiella cohnii]WBL16902.1 hypothetical protein O1A01_09820 [Sutcliffiella sp. NC1]
MRKLVFLMFMSSVLISLVGCNFQSDSKQVNEANSKAEEEKLLVEKRVGTEDKYEKFKEITDKEKVEKALNILKNADWENAKVKMAHPPDFRINNKYLIWLTPQKDMLEVIIQGENKYTKLSKKDSEVLYEIITEEKLGE